MQDPGFTHQIVQGDLGTVKKRLVHPGNNAHGLAFHQLDLQFVALELVGQAAQYHIQVSTDQCGCQQVARIDLNRHAYIRMTALSCRHPDARHGLRHR